MATLPKLVYRFNMTKIPAGVFSRNWQADPKIYVEMKISYNSQNILKKNRVVGPPFSEFKATVAKTVWYWYKDCKIDKETERRVQK